MGRTLVRITTLLALVGLFVALLLGASPSTAGAVSWQPANVMPDGSYCGSSSYFSRSYATGIWQAFPTQGGTNYEYRQLYHRYTCYYGTYFEDWYWSK